MKISLFRNNKEYLTSESDDNVYLVVEESYQKGDKIILQTDGSGFVTMQLDAVLGRCTVFSNGKDFVFEIPFEEARRCYHPAAFCGDIHFLWCRNAYSWECGYRNIAYNPYDYHKNEAAFPHSYANVETRGESVFASRNAMDGIVASNGHGQWPWASWGINRDPNATMTIDFGRPVEIDRVILYTRADFPHDAWWTEAKLSFSDNSEIKLNLEKKDGPQMFEFERRTVESITLSELIKADDPSPFPALIQIEVYGSER